MRWALSAVFLASACSGGVVSGGLPPEALVPVEGAPKAYEGAAITFDRSRSREVLFAGSETFELAVAGWMQVAATGPSARTFAAMAYDEKRARVTLFGGTCAEGCCDDTWTWDGASWSKLPTAAQPQARSGATMSWDAQREELLLANGSACDEYAEPFRDLWSFDGTIWKQTWP